MNSRKRLKWIGAVVLVALAVLFIAYFPGRPPSFPVPTPNGYDDFVRAAALNQKALENADVRQIYNKLPDATRDQLGILRAKIENDDGLTESRLAESLLVRGLGFHK